METCVYPGSFDPVTNGHIDIISRACRLFDTVYVGVLHNPSKQGMFSVEERCRMIEAATSGFKNVRVVAFEGLLVDLLQKIGSRIVIRGLRTSTDLELEQQYSFINSQLLEGAETLALLSRPETYFISSTAVRELIAFGADISEYVPAEVAAMINGGEKA